MNNKRALDGLATYVYFHNNTRVVSGSAGLPQHELKLSEQIQVRSYIFLSNSRKSLEGFSLSSNVIYRLREASEISILSQP